MSVLESFGPDAKMAIPALAELLQGDDDELRSPAAEVLGKIGPAAIPALTELLRDKNGLVRRGAASALWQITHDPKQRCCP